MQLFHTIAVACAVFTSSAVVNPAVASPSSADDQAITIKCLNKGKLTHPDLFCFPPFSKGFKSSQDCFEEDGRGYYCIFPDGQEKCVDLSRFPRPDFEGGECFGSN